MEYTLVVAAIAVALALWLRPGAGLAVLIASTLLWPEYPPIGRIPLGVVQMSAPRFVALVLVARHASRWSRLRQHPCDWLVVLGYVLSVISVIAADADTRLITSTIGRGLDTVVMYFAARLCLLTFQDVKDMRMPIAFTAFAVCAMSAYEALNPGHDFIFFNGAEEIEIGQGSGGVGQTRWGMMRAQVATAHPIYFGVAMTIVAGFAIALRRAFATWMWLAVVTAALLSVFFSLSSGPWTAALLLIVLMPLWRASWLIKPSLVGLGICCAAIEFLGNRHFYYLICYIGLSNSTAWYRVRLLEVAFKYLHEYWLFGYGGRPFAHWGLDIDGRYFIDCVNNYVLIAALNGVATMLCYLLAKLVVVLSIARTWKRLDREHRWVTFALIACVVAVALGECSVSVFGPALLLNGILLGAGASAAGWVRAPLAAPARRGVAAPRFRMPGRDELADRRGFAFDDAAGREGRPGLRLHRGAAEAQP